MWVVWSSSLLMNCNLFWLAMGRLCNLRGGFYVPGLHFAECFALIDVPRFKSLRLNGGSRVWCSRVRRVNMSVGFVILGLAEGALKICEITSFDIERFSLTRKTQFNYEDLTN